MGCRPPSPDRFSHPLPTRGFPAPLSVPGPWRLEGTLDPPVPVFGPFSLVELTEEILKLLMDLVFRLVCNGELSLARVLRKNILDKVDQKKLLRCASSGQPLAAKGVAAR